MSIIHRQKDNHDNGYYIGSNYIEGTSARTRPFSFEQVMSRRRNKKHDEDDIPDEHAKEKIPASKLIPERGDAVNGPPHTGPASENNLRNDSKDMARSSKTKEETLPTRRRKDKMHHDLEANEKAKSSHEKSSKDRESKKEKESHRRIRAHDRSKIDFEKGSSRKHSKDTQPKHKHDGEEGKFMREKRRKNLNGNDEKTGRDMDTFTPKKHYPSQRQDLESLERRKVQRYEEQRSKRRRSRSQEYDRRRDRASASVSPRVHKRSFHGRDYMESSSRSQKDKAEMQYSDADKYRTSSNGGYEGGHFRRRGSGLGGYSPRKRRPDAAVIKIPSPTARSPERKGATWDLPPPDVQNRVSLPASGNKHSTQNVRDQAPSIPESPMKQSSQRTPPASAPVISLASIDSVHLTQATRPMRRLYIENLPASATDKSITGWLNELLMSIGANHIPGTQPCISCIINKEKSQAVVEFLTPEDATAALSLDGKSFSGFIVKLRRPKDFIDATPTTGLSEKPAAVVNTVSDVVKDSPYKIFVGGITKYLSSDMLLEIAGAFGPVKAYHFEFNSELNQPCAFLEYVDQSITQKACAALNGMKLGGNVLTVVIALEDTNLGEEKDEKPPFYGIPEHARPLLEEPTQVLKLQNVFDQETFLQLSESELEETVEDIRIECARFGTVKSVNVVRHENRCTVTMDVEDPMDEAGKMVSVEDTVEGNTNRITEPVSSDDVEETSESGEALRKSEASVDNVEPDLQEGDYHQSNQLTADAIEEGPLEAEVAGGEPATVNVADKLEGSHNESGLVRDESKQVEVNTGLGESFSTLDSTVPEKSCASVDEDSHQSVDHLFGPGCVLVEFLRKEATCMAAHSLNGRIYDGRRVAASYVVHDIYVAHFRR